MLIHSTNPVTTLWIVSPSDWAQLTSITWKVYNADSKWDHRKLFFECIIKMLKALSHLQNLQEVTVVLVVHSLQNLLISLLPSVTELCAELENTLIMFPVPTLSFSPWPEAHKFNKRQHHSWIHMIARFFPELTKRGALRVGIESLCE